ncbi:MAG: DUF2975 domain-containing protein [Croceibacterium sp.]
MSRIRHDPLLTAAKVLLYIFIGLFIFAMAMVAIGSVAVLTVGHGELTKALAEAGAPEMSFWAVIAVLLLAELLLFLILRFCLELRRIVLSVDDGDPFHPDNATRLSRMGWLALAGWATMIPIAAIASWIDRTVGDAADIDVHGGVDLDGVLLALVLFILARVFRHGAQMREELEGTV